MNIYEISGRGRNMVCARRKLRSLGKAHGAVLALLLAPAAQAACTVGTGGVDFGAYDVFNGSPTDSTSTITVSCDSSASYTVLLSSGNGTYDARYLSSSPDSLFYNLYTDATLSTIWGDGSAGTGTVGGITLGGTQENHTVYGRIPAGQNVSAGTYLDSIIVTVEF